VVVWRKGEEEGHVMGEEEQRREKRRRQEKKRKRKRKESRGGCLKNLCRMFGGDWEEEGVGLEGVLEGLLQMVVLMKEDLVDDWVRGVGQRVVSPAGGPKVADQEEGQKEEAQTGGQRVEDPRVDLRGAGRRVDQRGADQEPRLRAVAQTAVAKWQRGAVPRGVDPREEGGAPLVEDQREEGARRWRSWEEWMGCRLMGEGNWREEEWRDWREEDRREQVGLHSEMTWTVVTSADLLLDFQRLILSSGLDLRLGVHHWIMPRLAPS
jgi:hypothetical protein